TGGDVPLRKAEYGVLSLPTMIGEDPFIYSILMLLLIYQLCQYVVVNNIFIYFHSLKNNSRGGPEAECGSSERKKTI
ncbi:hypothetical protein SJ301_25755, partial [Klebsiella pneumoniae]